jgi:NADH-quinone oxidoreductase subunit I
MGIKKGNPNERDLSFVDKLYYVEIAKGMAFSFKHMFRKKVTIRYPEERPVLGPEFRGRPVLVQEHGQERCVACGLCARACPPLAISMQAGETTDAKERYPETFEINMLRCIYCGFCEDVCPEEAIIMSDEYDFNFRTRQEAIYAKDRLLIDIQDLKGRLEFLKKKRNPNFGGELYDFQKGNNNHSVRDRA